MRFGDQDSEIRGLILEELEQDEEDARRGRTKRPKRSKNAKPKAEADGRPAGPVAPGRTAACNASPR